MIITMQVGATPAQIEAVAEAIREQGAEPLIMPGEDRTAIGIPSALGADKRSTLEAILGSLEGVSKITQTSRPYKLASIEFHLISPALFEFRDRPHFRAKPERLSIASTLLLQMELGKVQMMSYPTRTGNPREKRECLWEQPVRP